VNWYYISAYQTLSELFIREFKDNVDWDYISMHQTLSEEFIREFQDKVIWIDISIYQKLSEEFIREFQNKVCWENISENQKLSEEFIREFQDKVDWEYISKYQKLSKEFFETIKAQTQGQYDLEVQDITKIVNKKTGEVIFEGYKDLYKLTVDFFKDAKYGLFFTIGYVLAMLALAFHLWHGFQSAFQSLGVNNKFTPTIKFFGRAFAIIVPLLFAIIPVILHFKK
jgi:hypothetical protein